MSRAFANGWGIRFGRICICKFETWVVNVCHYHAQLFLAAIGCSTLPFHRQVRWSLLARPFLTGSDIVKDIPWWHGIVNRSKSTMKHKLNQIMFTNTFTVTAAVWVLYNSRQVNLWLIPCDSARSGSLFILLIKCFQPVLFFSDRGRSAVYASPFQAGLCATTTTSSILMFSHPHRLEIKKLRHAWRGSLIYAA